MKQTKVIRKSLYVLLVLFLTFSLYGQDKKNDVTKEEIIKKAWNVMFGELKSSDIKSIYIEGYFHGSKVPNKTIIKRPNLFRNETSSGMLVFDGKRAAWVKRNPDEQGNPRNPEMIEQEYWKHFEVDIAIQFPAFFDYPSEYRGIKNINDKKAFELFVQLPLGGNVSYFIDEKSFLVTERTVSWDGEPNEELWENQITGYVNYNGILFPDGYTFKGRDGMEKGFFKNVKFNTDPADELFKIPDELN